MHFERDKYVVVTNPKHYMANKIGKTIMHFTSGPLAGKILVSFHLGNSLMLPEEIQLLSQTEIKHEVSNPKIHHVRGIL
jgi:hypothetical protein